MRTRCLLVGLAFVLGAGVAHPAPRKQARPRVLPEELVESLMARSNPGPLARARGIDMFAFDARAERASGRTTRTVTSGDVETPRSSRRLPSRLTDTPIANDPALTQRQPTVVVHPGYSRRLVTSYASTSYPEPPTNRCVVQSSTNRGRTWSAPVFLPTLDEESICGDPVIAYSADGHRLYAAYQDSRLYETDPEPDDGGPYTDRSGGDVDIVVSVSRDGGRTWSKPVPALDGAPWERTISCVPGPSYDLCELVDKESGFSYDRPSLAVEQECIRNPLVFVTGTRFAEFDDTLEPVAIAFASSPGARRNWSDPVLLDTVPAVVKPPLVQGGSVATGPGGALLAAWYHSSDDGRYEGKLEIRTRYSHDQGVSWGPVVKAATDMSEAPRYLGPPVGNVVYKWWWTVMFPSVAIDQEGRAHVAYTHDPTEGNSTSEDGDIRYITSGSAPYTDWSVIPETVNDDEQDRSQGFPSLAVRRDGGQTIVELVWEDTRLSPDGTGITDPIRNVYYDIFHARRVPGPGALWSPNTRVSDESSIQDGQNASGRPGLAAYERVVYTVWTDRRTKTSVEDRDTDVYGSRIDPGRVSR